MSQKLAKRAKLFGQSRSLCFLCALLFKCLGFDETLYGTLRGFRCNRSGNGPRLSAPNGPLNSPINARILAECLEQLVVDAADDAKAVVRAIGKNRAASALASYAIDRAAIIAVLGQRLLHRYDQGVIIGDDIAAINGRISTVIRVGTVVIVIRITIPVAVTIKGRTDPTIIAMMPMMPTSVMLVIAVMATAVIATTVLLVPAMIPTAMLLVPAAMPTMPAAVLPVPLA